MKKVIIIILISLISIQNYAQDWNSELSMHSQFTKTPEATMLDRFQNYPVSNSVGIPDINIPLYTIKVGDLELPISLSYHLGGHKVNDIATWVGLGWNLNVGGMVSRQIKGIHDEEKSYGFLNSPELSFNAISGGKITGKVPFKEEIFNKMNDYGEQGFLNINGYLEQLADEVHDMGSDIYTYSMNDLSGSFVYDMDRNLVNIPYSDNKIERNLTNNTFTITNPNGTIYNFSDKEELYLPDKRVKIGIQAVSNWKISTITSSSSSNSIKFTYGNPIGYKVYNRSATLSAGYRSDGSGYEGGGSNYSFSYTEFYERSLTKIDFDNGSIEFILNSTERQDKKGHYSLRAIVVKDKNGTEIKRVGFNYSYFQSSNTSTEDANYRLKLESIEISGSRGGTPIKYKFSYNEDRLPARCSDQPSLFSLGQDLWGYYNGVKTNRHLVGKISGIDLENYGPFLQNNLADRTSSESYMQSWTLTKIDYPTGGYTEFFTEANRDKDNKIVGGLRIAKMISKPDAKSSPVTTVYTYEDPHYMKLSNDNKDYESYKYRVYIGLKGLMENQFTNHPRYYFTEEPFSGLFFNQGSPVFYKKVIKKEQGQGKAEYTYSNPYIYRQVISANPTTGQTYVTPRYPYIENLQSWVMGKLEREAFYKESESKPFKTIDYIYRVDHKKRVIIGKHVYRRHIINYPLNGVLTHASGLFDIFWEEYETGFYKLAETVETMDGVSTSTKYQYGKVNTTTASNIQLTQKDETVNNKTITHEYKYPRDFTDAVSKEMVKKNMVNVLLENITKTGNTHLSTQKRTFAKFGNFYKPATEQSKKATSGTFTTDITYDLYDKRGNLRQYTMPDGLVTTLLWSYNGQYPVAEIKNADFKTNIANLIGESRIDNMLNSTTISQQENGLINLLREGLPASYITTYTHTPLIGVSTVTSPSGITTYYDYDQYGRLVKTYTTEENKAVAINSFSYQYVDGAGWSSTAFIAPKPNLNTSKEIKSVIIPETSSAYKAASTFTVKIDGGSGYYDYEWSIGGSIKSRTSDYKHTAQDFNSFTLTCKVTDQISGVTKTTSKTIKIDPYVLKFEDRQYSTDSREGVGTIKAKIWSPVDATITIRSTFLRASERREPIRATFYMPPYSYEQNDTCGAECKNERTITLKAGDNYATIQIFKGTHIYQGSSRAEIQIISTSTSSVTIPKTPDVLSLIY
ncbi:hypothetical protein [Prevotella sp. 10(H)]|uniref:hypothetical protein n=1 Tax=Prevotella sp. 10(H) TaxID=1158294 RepID=UPI0004A6C1DF|nr:hypothetical protein [Prevotella sp. 10(H)]